MVELPMDETRKFLEQFDNIPSAVWKEIREFEKRSDIYYDVSGVINDVISPLGLPIPVGVIVLESEALDMIIDMAKKYKGIAK